MFRDWIWEGERRRGMRVLLAASGVIALVYLVLLGSWARACRDGACPDPAGLERLPTRETSIIYAADGSVLAQMGDEQRRIVPLDSTAPILRTAFIVTEDKRFFRHHGVDFIRVLGAAWRNIVQGGYREGFSTLSMQLARNLWPETIDPRERSLTRKIREIQVAFGIEARFSKRRILELYLNQVPLGPQVYGVEAASRQFFGKSAAELNPAEAALLAALPKAPTSYNPRRHPERALARRNLVLDLLRRHGDLTPAEAEGWKRSPLTLVEPDRPTVRAPYFVDYIRQQIAQRFRDRLPYGGLRIYTTLDPGIQAAAEQALNRQLDAVERGAFGAYPRRSFAAYQKRHDQSDAQGASPYLQGMVVVEEAGTGRVLAMVGGRDYSDSEFNRATAARRQAGSAFKPFVYSAAVRQGNTLSRVIDDEPITVPATRADEPDWTPQNSDLAFQGPITLRRALYLSRNAATVRLGLDIGLAAVIAEARRFGITTPIRSFPSVFLGAVDVAPIELVSAYTAFATDGVRAEPMGIVRVEDRDGITLWEPGPRRKRVLDPAQAWLMTSALRDVIRHGTAYAATTGAGFTLPAGGKTGTSDGYADAWFIGFTPDLVAGVWIGMDRRQAIFPGANGGRVAAPVWTTLMRAIYHDRPRPGDWQPPAGVITVPIDASTGFLATAFCPDTLRRYESYLPGTEPRQYCPVHTQAWADSLPTDSVASAGGR